MPINKSLFKIYYTNCGKFSFLFSLLKRVFILKEMKLTVKTLASNVLGTKKIAALKITPVVKMKEPARKILIVEKEHFVEQITALELVL